METRLLQQKLVKVGRRPGRVRTQGLVCKGKEQLVAGAVVVSHKTTPLLFSIVVDFAMGTPECDLVARVKFKPILL